MTIMTNPLPIRSLVRTHTHPATSDKTRLADELHCTHLESSQGMQLSIAKDHSPTITGSTAQVWYRSMDVYEHAIRSWTYIFCLEFFPKRRAIEVEAQQTVPTGKKGLTHLHKWRGEDRTGGLAECGGVAKTACAPQFQEVPADACSSPKVWVYLCRCRIKHAVTVPEDTVLLTCPLPPCPKRHQPEAEIEVK